MEQVLRVVYFCLILAVIIVIIAVVVVVRPHFVCQGSNHEGVFKVGGCDSSWFRPSQRGSTGVEQEFDTCIFFYLIYNCKSYNIFSTFMPRRILTFSFQSPLKWTVPFTQLWQVPITGLALISGVSRQVTAAVRPSGTARQEEEGARRWPQ